jgi:outer membrane murein-binding lipoprotein Lpp
LGAPSDSDVDSLRSENEKLKEQVSTLEGRVTELEKELEAAREAQ